MRPIEEAKARVARLFAALSAPHDCTWRELVAGGFEASTSLPSGRAVAKVDIDGEYEVIHVIGDRRVGTLISGSFKRPGGIRMREETEKAESFFVTWPVMPGSPRD